MTPLRFEAFDKPNALQGFTAQSAMVAGAAEHVPTYSHPLHVPLHRANGKAQRTGDGRMTGDPCQHQEFNLADVALPHRTRVLGGLRRVLAMPRDMLADQRDFAGGR